MTLLGVLGLMALMAVIGFAAWYLATKVEMPQAVKLVIIIFAVVVCVLMAMVALGLHIPNPRVL